jgi:mannose-6-phosphate isomerase-like protein (cupin superfamily)
MVLSLCFCSGIEATEPGKGRFVVVPFNEGLDFFPGKWKITKEGTNGAYALVEVNDKSPREIEPHRHTREDEAWYVIEGELQFEIGEESATAGPGTFVYAPRDVRHCFKVTKVPARYLILFSPAGIEAFFSEVDELRKKLGEGTSEFRKLRDEVRAKYGVMPEEKRGSKSP